MSELSTAPKPDSKDFGTDPRDPTADYRKYPEGPNFLLIVILACVALIVIVGGAILLLRGDASHLVPQRPNQHPNSSWVLPAQPLVPGGRVGVPAGSAA